MKKISTLLMLLCIVFSAHAQLLWKVTGNGLTAPSYLFGTHHLSPLSITDSVAGLEQAMQNTKQVYGELVMEDMLNPTNMQQMQQAMILPGDTTLHHLLSEAQYDSVAMKVKQIMGVDLKMFDKLKPAAITTQLAVIIAVKAVKGFNPQQQVDTWMQNEAKKLGKKIGALETPDFQTYVLFNSQSLQRQAEQMYYSFMNIDELEQQTLSLTKAYMAQDLNKLNEVMNKKNGNASDPLPEEEETLIYGRNAKWAKVMPGIMKENATLFVVGSGHLPGERGVLNLLKQQGFTVEPVK